MRSSAKVAVSVSVVFLALGALGGCGSSAAKGGDVTCGEYKKMSSSEKEKTIRAFLKEGGEKEEPSNGKVTAMKLSAKLFCATAGSDDSKIREMNG